MRRLASACALLVLLLSSCQAFAGNGDRVHFAKSIYVAEGENAGDLICLGCSIRMEGTCGDLVAIGGSVSVDGDVKGDAVAVGGSMQLAGHATVAGDAVAVGGRVWRHPEAVVKGDVVSRSGAPVFLALFFGLVVVPLLPIIVIIALVVWLVRRNRESSPAQFHRP